MHRPFVTTVKFENENGGALRLDYAVAAVDTFTRPLRVAHRRDQGLEGIEHHVRATEAPELRA